MRQIFLDTETTGLDPAQGHRVIEIAAVEAVDRRLTQRRFHTYLNPEREVDSGAEEIHGMNLEFLQDKPRFTDVAAEFLDFIAGGELIIHNAPFDVAFLDQELALAGYPELLTACAGVVDTLKMAKEMRPGQRNSLDNLCRHYGVDNSSRTLHGALLDAELLADVYLAMTRGQDSLAMDIAPVTQRADAVTESVPQGVKLRVVLAADQDLEAHTQYLAGMAAEGNCLWDKVSQGIAE